MDESPQASVVLHFRDGRTAKEASLPEIDSARLRVVAAGVEVPFEELKAVFFRREGTMPAAPPEPGGSLVSVEFADGEILRGVARDYTPLAPGFYLTPLEESKLDRVFVVSSAVVSIEVEKL